MLDVGLVGVLAVWVALVTWRALLGAPPPRPIRFSVVLAVSAVIHLGFHAAATAAPTLDAVALVLSGWSTFGMWCLWLGRLPSRGFRQSEDEGGGDGGGGGHGPDDDGRPGDGPGPGGDDDVDWEVFEREFAAYVERARPPAPEPGLEPAAD
jgi:hypothetical protein